MNDNEKPNAIFVITEKTTVHGLWRHMHKKGNALICATQEEGDPLIRVAGRIRVFVDDVMDDRSQDAKFGFEEYFPTLAMALEFVQETLLPGLPAFATRIIGPEIEGTRLHRLHVGNINSFIALVNTMPDMHMRTQIVAEDAN